MPLDPDLIREDIVAIRSKVDYVILSFHCDIFRYDIHRQHELHPGAVAFAHAMIDAGADAIVGTDCYVVRSVELYQGKPIYYSTANLIFSFGVPQCDDNLAARLILSKDKIERAELIPIAGRGPEIAQPYQLGGLRAKTFFGNLQSMSDNLGTKIGISGDKGILQ